MHHTNYLVVGSGIAGAYAALGLAENAQVTWLVDAPTENEYLLGQELNRADLSVTEPVDSRIRADFFAAPADSISGGAVWETLLQRCAAHPAICCWIGQNLVGLAQAPGEKRCVGALAGDRGGNVYFVHAEGVVLAGGGVSRLYQSDARTLEVNALALARKAGCRLSRLGDILFTEAGIYGRGGIAVGSPGDTGVEGLYALGEVAAYICPPAELLLTDLRSAVRAARDLPLRSRRSEGSSPLVALMGQKQLFRPDADAAESASAPIDDLMRSAVGVKRDPAGLQHAQNTLEQWAQAQPPVFPFAGDAAAADGTTYTVAGLTAAYRIEVARWVVASARELLRS
jgi:aspartate oxidase